MTEYKSDSVTELPRKQKNEDRDWRSRFIALLFLLLSAVCVLCSSQSALYFINRERILGGIEIRNRADYGPAPRIQLAPLDPEKILSEIVQDRLELSATPSTPIAGSIVVTLPEPPPIVIAPTPTTVRIVVAPSPSPTSPAEARPPTASPTEPSAEPTSTSSSSQPSAPTPTPTPTAASPTPVAPSSTPVPPSPTSPATATPRPPTPIPPTSTPAPTNTPTTQPTATSTPTSTPSPTVTPTPTPTNQPPAVVDDNALAAEDTTIPIDVLANDSDADGTIIAGTLQVVTQAINGTALVDAGSSQVTYVPNQDFNGVDTFVYRVCDDDGACGSAIVTVDVTPVNDPPTPGDDQFTTAEDIALPIDVLSNDTDVDGDSLSISAVGVPSHGQLMTLGNSLIYTPTLNFNGTDSFTYTVTDGLLNASASVTMTVTAVNDPPVANDDLADTAEDTSEIVPVLANDVDVDGDPLTVIAVSQPANGTANTNGSVVIYSPNTNFDGTELFTYTISDGLISDTATITVSLISINDPPVAQTDAYTTSQNSALSVAAPGVLLNDIDVDGDPLSAALNSGPAVGSLTLAASGAFTYTPASGFTGTDSFTYVADDGLATSSVVTVTLVVQ